MERATGFEPATFSLGSGFIALSYQRGECVSGDIA